MAAIENLQGEIRDQAEDIGGNWCGVGDGKVKVLIGEAKGDGDRGTTGGGGGGGGGRKALFGFLYLQFIAFVPTTNGEMNLVSHFFQTRLSPLIGSIGLKIIIIMGHYFIFIKYKSYHSDYNDIDQIKPFSLRVKVILQKTATNCTM